MASQIQAQKVALASYTLLISDCSDNINIMDSQPGARSRIHFIRAAATADAFAGGHYTTWSK